ncbi:hypothetical protein GCM10023224_02150 [Streptomonospora halophila]|uniref:Uncharacterized protein n=1 Tax=Streptomonospora halophila TaxID=427369 RepID=A0ABP9G4D1_9ACTN
MRAASAGCAAAGGSESFNYSASLYGVVSGAVPPERRRVRGRASEGRPRPAAEGAGGVAGPGSAGAAAGGGYRPFAARCCCQRSIRAGNSPIMNS